MADRPDQPVVGLAVSHESADLHVTGAALYTQDLVGRTHGTLHAWPVQAPHAHARITGLRAEAAYDDFWAEDPACYLTEEEIGTAQ
jgi:xanthine dehydrogenase large subunit